MWSLDALFKPWESPYAAYANNPISFVDPLGLDGEASPLHPGTESSSFWHSISDFLSNLDLGNSVGDTWQPNVLPEEATDLMQINIWMYDFFKSNINSWYIIYQQFGCHHADFKTKDLDGNEVSDTEVAITTGLEILPIPEGTERIIKKALINGVERTIKSVSTTTYKKHLTKEWSSSIIKKQGIQDKLSLNQRLMYKR